MKSAKKAVKKAAVARKKAAAKKAGRVARKGVGRPKVAAVAAANGDAKVDAQSAFQEEHTIEVRNFGPIVEAKLALKPLSVLIGPSNTGKTYMATLACMMMKKHVDFARDARDHMGMSMYESMLEKMSGDKLRQFVDNLAFAIQKDRNGGNFIFLSALPSEIRKLLHPIAERTFKNYWNDIDSDMKGYYGVGSTANLVASAGQAPFACQYKAGGHQGGMVSVRVGMSNGRMTVPTPKFLDMRFSISPEQIIRELARVQQNMDASEHHHRDLMMISRVIFMILRERTVNPTVHFLPASRGGLLQAQRLMSMSMMRIGSRAGLAEIPAIPTLSRTSVSFMEDVNFLLEVLSSSSEKHSERTAKEAINALKETEQLLEGEIIAKKSGGNGNESIFSTVPTMDYRPARPIGANAVLEMAESSSMVSEIAPLVLYLRGGVGLGDTLFIEEPEAHLHPAAQTKMARILAAMVRAGIRVVITTHSDWLLDSIADLVRQGESGSGDGKTTLKDDDVGVWLFRRENRDAGSTAIPVPFDNSGGYIPESLSDFFIASHNQSAGLRVAYEQAQRQKKRQ